MAKPASMRKKMNGSVNERRTWRRFLRPAAMLWFVGVGASLWGWSAIDATVGPAEPAVGRVRSFQLDAKNRRMVKIEMGDGTVVTQTGNAPVGSEVQCLRYVRRYWPNDDYDCSRSD